MQLKEALAQCQKYRRAFLATNFYNMETLFALVRAAGRATRPIILQTSPSTLDYVGLEVAINLARAATRQFQVDCWLHLDHCHELDMIQQCIEAGYDSVMIDASEKDMKTNIALTQQVVRMARPACVCVEAELGYVPKLGQKALTNEGLTDPQQAKVFAGETGVDMLAISIGTAHGFYKKEPNLDFDRLNEIRQLTDIPLVLHGGSGVPESQWRQAIDLGIVKINFATEIKNAFTGHLKKTLSYTDDIDLRRTFLPAIQEVEDLVRRKIEVCANDNVHSD